MRNYLFLVLASLSLGGGACKWTDFDDLEGETWARSMEDPDLGATDYAVAIAGVSTGASGGTLAVLSDDTANFSTIVYTSSGDADVGANPIKLGTQSIGAIADAPIFATDPTGRIGIVERSITAGNFAVVFGSATAPAGLEFPAMSQPAPVPDAAIFVPNGATNDLVFAAGPTLYTIPAAGGSPTMCSGMDNNAMPLSVAAMSHDDTNLWVWTKSGSLISYPLASLTTGCGGGSLPNPGANAFTPSGGFMPAPGARVHVAGNFAILTGHPMTSRSGSVFVVDLTNLEQVGTTMVIEGMRTSTVAALGGDTYLVVGVPDRAIGGIAAGAVDVHAFDPTTGELTAAPATTLHDVQPDSGQLFGRTVTTMSFNGNAIIVVGADSEVFAYYRTALYDFLP